MTKGILDMEADKKARIALAKILRNGGGFSYEQSFIDRVTTMFDRFYTVAEADRIHHIAGRIRFSQNVG